jgi:hypothetical protein
MTVEIKELVIKATVTDKMKTGNENQATDRDDTGKMVDLCVAEVLKILKREKER